MRSGENSVVEHAARMLSLSKYIFLVLGVVCIAFWWFKNQHILLVISSVVLGVFWFVLTVLFWKTRRDVLRWGVIMVVVFSILNLGRMSQSDNNFAAGLQFLAIAACVMSGLMWLLKKEILALLRRPIEPSTTKYDDP